MLLSLLNSFKLNLKTVNLTRNNVSKRTISEIHAKLQGSSDPEFFSHDLISDDNRSLATSEPPLENIAGYDYHDYANMSRPQSAHALSIGDNESGHFSGTGNRQTTGIGGKSSALDSRSLVDLASREEPSLDLKKARSVENLSKYGVEAKEYEAYFPDDEVLSKPAPKDFLRDTDLPRLGDGELTKGKLKLIDVDQAAEDQRVEMNTNLADFGQSSAIGNDRKASANSDQLLFEPSNASQENTLTAKKRRKKKGPVM